MRTCLDYTQPAFAKLVGCSAIAIQRIENGSLPLSPKLANTIMEATGANPAALLKGKALDMDGQPFTKKTSESFKSMVPCVDHSAHHRNMLVSWIELLLIASERAGQDKSNAVAVNLQRFLKKLAVDFNLEKNIYGFLNEQGAVRKRAYRISDLRKFSAYAKILGFKDNKRYKPMTIKKFKIPTGWIPDFAMLEECPVLPKELEKQHKDTFYLFDCDRPVPKEIEALIAQAEYWKIKSFRLQFGDKPRA